MTDTIWKFPLGYDGEAQFKIDVPERATPLHVDFDPQGQLVLWARVDPTSPPRTTVVTVVGTGQPIPDDAGEYVSTFTSEPFVFHAFYTGVGASPSLQD